MLFMGPVTCLKSSPSTDMLLLIAARDFACKSYFACRAQASPVCVLKSDPCDASFSGLDLPIVAQQGRCHSSMLLCVTLLKLINHCR